jgi:stearoyl-CoA desaturase (delta-9 desaturase)
MDTLKHSNLVMSVIRWFDSDAGIDEYRTSEERRVEWLRILPFIVLHVMCLGVIWVGWSWTAIAVA